MSRMQQLYDVSLRLFQETEVKHDSNVDRDEQISNIEQLLDERKSVLDSMNQEDFKGDGTLSKKIILLTEEIDRRLVNIKDAIRKDLTGVTTLKKKQSNFVNPYANVRVDGMYIDKRL